MPSSLLHDYYICLGIYAASLARFANISLSYISAVFDRRLEPSKFGCGLNENVITLGCHSVVPKYMLHPIFRNKIAVATYMKLVLIYNLLYSSTTIIYLGIYGDAEATNTLQFSLEGPSG